ncbi:MAG: PaaI family thioesterase [Candidatus Eisenbacteria bacterium]|nr:PaaI family thioesterase [Candidatus Eisenbacteria bacterium]
MQARAFQDYYPEQLAHCYGCGYLNDRGHQIKSYWDGDETVCRYRPKPYHTAIPGYVYGGLLASLIDCHCTGTASAAMYRRENREMGTEPPLRFVTASLRVDYLRPTPMGVELEIRAKVLEMTDRKVVMEAWIEAGDQVTVKGKVVTVVMPEHLVEE